MRVIKLSAERALKILLLALFLFLPLSIRQQSLALRQLVQQAVAVGLVFLVTLVAEAARLLIRFLSFDFFELGLVQCQLLLLEKLAPERVQVDGQLLCEVLPVLQNVILANQGV